jgi:two-component system nitrogen regulation sensor histidine kinase NtrY
MGLATVIFVLIIRLPAVSWFSAGSLRIRLQSATMGILLISFIIIGLVVIVNIVRLTSNKNADYLNEKTMSIFVEFQHKFGNSDNLTESGQEELENLLVKLSNVFFTDINIYNGSGQIVASSRPQVFDESLISKQIDPEAYWNLKHEKSSIFIHQEKIGNYSYSSTYIPLYNDRNVLLGYINLPFFSRQDEIKKEISSFLVAFINVYLLLILIGIHILFRNISPHHCSCLPVKLVTSNWELPMRRSSGSEGTRSGNWLMNTTG